MRKLIYISLAALALQTCVSAQTATAPSTASTSTSGNVYAAPDLSDQMGAIGQHYKSNAQEGAARAGASIDKQVEKEKGKGYCQFRILSGACKLNVNTALGAMDSCYNHPIAARDCFREICEKFNENSSDYNQAIGSYLKKTWKRDDGNTVTGENLITVEKTWFHSRCAPNPELVQKYSTSAPVPAH